MKAGVRIGAYAGVLVLVLGGSFYLAPLVRDHKLWGPWPSPLAAVSSAPALHGAPQVADPQAQTDEAKAGEATMPVAATATAMSAAAGGYRLVTDTTSFPAGVSQPFRFQLLGADGQPLHVSPDDADDLHVSLVVVRRDGAAFSHFDPVQDMTGTWTAPVRLPSGGSYAAWVSFTPRSGGREVVLGTDVSVAGEFSPQTAPSPAPSADVEGYRAELAGTPTIGADTELTLTVSRDGKQVSDLQIDDGAFAHLVMIRAGDLAFLDAHPQLVPGQDGALRFTVHLPAAGTYWSFVDFRHQDQTHTAALTMAVPDPATATPTPTAAPSTTEGTR